MVIKDTILATLQLEQANQAHKITVMKPVQVTKQVPVKVTKQVVTQVPVTHQETTVTTNEDGSTNTVTKDVTETQDVTVDQDVIEFQDQTETIDQPFEEDAPPYFSDPLDQIADGIVAQVLGIIKTEIQKPAYQGKTDQECADIINSIPTITTTTDVVLPAAKDRVIALANDQWTLYTKYAGNLGNAIQGEIANEIANDPDGRGYAGKTNDEQLALMSQPFTKQVTTTTNGPHPILMDLLQGISYAPNLITADDIAAAKAL